ncbi:U3 small nucleolar RNA-associated protein 4 [Nowakowskiella sp. JEL0407]|nr:U3 small nucleolar RNA-associated protein 4 [Nowakowskiella sp. JEL0407]
MECHRARFVEYVPSGIHALSFSPTTSKLIRLACVRENGDIELWNPKPAGSTNRGFFLERVIPGGPNSTVECIAWSHQTLPEADDAMNIVEDEEDEDEKDVTTESAHLKNLSPRLFSGGLNAMIHEYDFVKLQPKQSIESNGGAVWCMAVNNAQTRLVVGCEDSCVKIFNISCGGLTYVKSFMRQDGRILSIVWDNTDSFIYTGCSDSCIRKYDASTGRCVMRSTVDTTLAKRIGLNKKKEAQHSTLETGFLGFAPNEMKKKERTKSVEDTLVWSLVMLNDGTLVSGDSMGMVGFWDPATGTLKQAIKSHLADILCLVASKDGTTIYSSGIDRKVIQYRMVKTKVPSAPWVLSGEKRYHSHDVRAIALFEDRPIDALVTGGVDTQLTVSQPASKFPNDVYHTRTSALTTSPMVSFAKTSGLVLARFSESLKLFKLGTALPTGTPLTELNDKERLDVGHFHKLLLELNLQVSSNITAAAISDNGKWIVVSDIFCVKLFRITQKGSKPVKATKVVIPSPQEIPAANRLEFTPDSKRFIAATFDSTVIVVNIVDEVPMLGEMQPKPARIEVAKVFEEHRGVNGDDAELISCVSVSGDGQWMATGDLKNRIYLFNLDTLKVFAEFPKHKSPLTCIYFHPTSPTLFISLCSNEFFCYDVENVDQKNITFEEVDEDAEETEAEFNLPVCKLSDWSREFSHLLPKKLLGKRDIVKGIGVCPDYPDNLYLWASSWVAKVDLMKPLRNKDRISKRKHEDVEMKDAGSESAKNDEVPEWAKGMEMIEISEDEDIDSKPKRKQKPTSVAPSNPEYKQEGEYDPDVAEEGDEMDRRQNAGVTFIDRFATLMGVAFFGSNEEGANGKLVVVERPHLEIARQLPPSFYRHNYASFESTLSGMIRAPNGTLKYPFPTLHSTTIARVSHIERISLHSEWLASTAKNTPKNQTAVLTKLKENGIPLPTNGMTIYFCTAVFVWYLILAFTLLKVTPTKSGKRRPDNPTPDPTTDVDLIVPPKTKFELSKGIGILYLFGTVHSVFLVINTCVSIGAGVFTKDGFFTVQYPTVKDDLSLGVADSAFVAWETMYALMGTLESVLWWMYVLKARRNPALFITYRGMKSKTAVTTFTSSSSTAVSSKTAKKGKYGMLKAHDDFTASETDPNFNAFSSKKNGSKVNVKNDPSSSKTTLLGESPTETSYLVSRQPSSEDLQKVHFSQDPLSYKIQQQQPISNPQVSGYANMNLSSPQTPTTPKIGTPVQPPQIYQSAFYMSAAPSPGFANVDTPTVNKTTETNSKRKNQQVVHPAIARITTPGANALSKKKSEEMLKEDNGNSVEMSMIQSSKSEDAKRPVSTDLESIYAMTASTDYQYAPYAKSEHLKEASGSVSEVVVLE